MGSLGIIRPAFSRARLEGFQKGYNQARYHVSNCVIICQEQTRLPGISLGCLGFGVWGMDFGLVDQKLVGFHCSSNISGGFQENNSSALFSIMMILGLSMTNRVLHYP